MDQLGRYMRDTVYPEADTHTPLSLVPYSVQLQDTRERERATRAILFASKGQLNLHARDAVLYRNGARGTAAGAAGRVPVRPGRGGLAHVRAKGEATGARE